MLMHFDSNIALPNTLPLAPFTNFNEDSAMSAIM